MKLIDLSVTVENSASEPMEIKVKRFDYFSGAKKICRNIVWNKNIPVKRRVKNLLKCLAGKKRLRNTDFPDNAFLSLDVVTLPTHMGTHIDYIFPKTDVTLAEICKAAEAMILEKQPV